MNCFLCIWQSFLKLNIFWNFCFCSALQSLAILIEYFLERRSGSQACFSQLMTKLKHFRKPPGGTLPLTRCPGEPDQGQVARRLGGCQDANLAVKSAVRTILLQYKLQTYGYILVKRTENPPEKFAREGARWKEEAVSKGKRLKRPKKENQVVIGEVRCRYLRLLESRGGCIFFSFFFLMNFLMRAQQMLRWKWEIPTWRESEKQQSTPECFGGLQTYCVD